MQKRPSRLGLIGMATGVLVLLGSIAGGVALAANGGLGTSSSAVRVGNESSETPGATPSAAASHPDDGQSEAAEQGNDADEDDATESARPNACPSPEVSPSPTPTMSHEASDEHHDGVCGTEDGHSGSGDD